MARLAHRPSGEHRRRPPLGSRVLIGLIAGAFVGVFLGERSSIFQIAADGFVKLLQMAVLPYLTVTITASIGGLRLEALRALGVRTLAVLAGLWAIAFAFAFAMPTTTEKTTTPGTMLLARAKNGLAGM